MYSNKEFREVIPCHVLSKTFVETFNISLEKQNKNRFYFFNTFDEIYLFAPSTVRETIEMA